jgi:hypothetical protein
MTNLIEKLIGEDENPHGVELVTLTPDQITHGVMSGNPLPFEGLAEALAHARRMPPQEREASWIRTEDEVLTLAQAEERLSALGQTGMDTQPVGLLRTAHSAKRP